MCLSIYKIALFLLTMESRLWDKTLPEGTTPASSTCKEHSLNSLNEELLQSQLEAQDMCKAVEKISSRVESLTAENQKLQSALETVRNEAESTKDLLAQKDDMLSDQMESLRELRSSNQELWAQCREFMRLTERNGALLETEMQPKGFESSPKEDVGLREKIRLLHSITHELKIGLTELLSSAEERNGARWSRSAPSHVYALSGNAEPDTLGGHESSSPLHEMDAISAELARLVDLSAVIQSKLCEGREAHQEDLRAFQTQHESQCDVLECLCRQLEKEKVILEKTLEELRGILGAQKVFCDAVETGTLQAIDSLKHELLSKEEELASAKLDLERKQSTISSMLNQLADHQALKDRESSLNTMLEEERNEIQAERRQRELFAAMERELFQKQLSDLQQPKDDESDILFWSDEDFKDFDSALNGVDALMRKLMVEHLLI